MQKEITIREIETTLNNCEDIEEPIIVKRENKKDVIIISIDEYQKNEYLSELSSKVAKGENDLKNNRVKDAKVVFGRLREKYGY